MVKNVIGVIGKYGKKYGKFATAFAICGAAYVAKKLCTNPEEHPIIPEIELDDSENFTEVTEEEIKEENSETLEDE